MKAAVVRSFSHPPVYEDFDDPSPLPDETIVNVSASALTPLTKAQASGKHYSSGDSLPFVPGSDGVGRTSAGRVYFAFPRAPFGAMAERTAVQRTLCVPLPDNVNDVTAAAAANPGMSSWAALTLRAKFEPGETVLINGATGAAGRMAIQIAKHLGAKAVVATGRNAADLDDLPALGGDAVISLDQPPDKLTESFRRHIRERRVDVILDYLWGPSAERIFEAVTGHADGPAERRIRYVQIGSVAGPVAVLPGGALRSSGLELMGSGLGSISNENLIHAIGAMLNAFVTAKLSVDAEPVPLKDVESAWTRDASRRIVFTI